MYLFFEKIGVGMPARENSYEKSFILIGEKIKELRIHAGYTSYENFAIEHDFSRRLYWGIEKGKNITLKSLVRILEIHQVTLGDFFGDERFG